MKQKSIEGIVLEIKDKSELMVDLAYSSLLYDNKTIAQEVYDLENTVDALYNILETKALEDVKTNKHSIDEALTLLRIAKAAEQIADAAQEIADVELRDIELHPILKMSIRESDVVFSRVQVQPSSILCGKTLGELKLSSETGITVIAIRHQTKWVYGPDKNTKLSPHDILFIKGPEDGEQHLISVASGKKNEL
jgi:uncharacterized protein with PhoU and TrkA domain